MVRITLDNLVPATIPAQGWRVGYRVKGTTGAYSTPVGSPFMTFPIVFDVVAPAGTLFDGFIRSDCGVRESTNLIWITPCACTDVSYSVNETHTGCKKLITTAPIITLSDYCFATTGNGAYSNFGARIYGPAFDVSDVMSAAGTVAPNIIGNSTISPQWTNPTASPTLGPMNREAVWIDSDCDGNTDPLSLSSGTIAIGGVYKILNFIAGDNFNNVGAINTSGSVFTAVGTTPTNWTHGSTLTVANVTIATAINNIGLVRTVYIGVGADNQFKLVHNGGVIVDTGTAVSVMQFKIWHLIPITLAIGVNYINLIGQGDGSVNDAMAMVVYDNTSAQLLAATSDAQLNILYKTSSIRGTTYDIAACPSGYSLDTSAGTGNYICRQTLTKVCNSAS